MNDPAVAFSRPEAGAHDTAELRGMIPRHTIDVLDAVSTAQRKSRIELAAEVLAKWADEQVHISNVIQAVTGGNPARAEAPRKDVP